MLLILILLLIHSNTFKVSLIYCCLLTVSFSCLITPTRAAYFWDSTAQEVQVKSLRATLGFHLETLLSLLLGI